MFHVEPWKSKKKYEEVDVQVVTLGREITGRYYE
jgi:hypothetical protein